MSVFTPVSQQQLEAMLVEYPIGKLVQFSGIDAGTDNSNYFVDTTEGQFVLTLFERLTTEELPFYLSLGDQLSEANCLVARPIHDNQGEALNQLAGKPAVLFQRLSGHHITTPQVNHCQQMGHALAKMHSADLVFQRVPENEFGLKWVSGYRDFNGWQESDDKDLFESLLSEFASLNQVDLPKGVIHADLFHDNALFNDGDLAGVIDWYFACFDWLLLDLAIMINDWCFDGDTIDRDKKAALLLAYTDVRILTEVEQKMLPVMQLFAACRFWLSRTLAWSELRDQAQAGITIKPPKEMKRLLLNIMKENNTM